ncbi:putative MRG domain containing protein [Blattamonas nauphoetae]|uniref:MRG domain containing protein n=1 Tax=Blattamonas nauphoetae TaxID=2049346 RepID=A0ABQ9YKJ1_9EUKA|nr:putative MRG domain containing protein [Blattamonas nauphoetae]
MPSTFTLHQEVYAIIGEIYYQAKIIQIINKSDEQHYLVHYLGYPPSSDDVLQADSLVEISEDSTEKYHASRAHLTKQKISPKQKCKPSNEDLSENSPNHQDDSSSSAEESPIRPQFRKENKNIIYSDPNQHISFSVCFPDSLRDILSNDLKVINESGQVHTIPSAVSITEILEAFNEHTFQKKEHFLNDLFTYFNGLITQLLLTPEERVSYQPWFDYVHLRSNGCHLLLNDDPEREHPGRRSRVISEPKEETEPPPTDIIPQFEIDGVSVELNIRVPVHKDITSPADLFGGVHLLRLISKLPLILKSSVQMKDEQFCFRLEQEVDDLLWFVSD